MSVGVNIGGLLQPLNTFAQFFEIGILGTRIL
jgi:hypothetical protein